MNTPGHRKDQAAEALRLRILTLDHPPGAALDEVALSDEFGLSRTPLREVFQRLAGEGYITLEKNRGASVSSMDLDTMRNFFQCAPLVYASIARLATEQASPAQLESLKSIQRLFAKAVTKKSVVDLALQNHRFHEQIGVMASSKYLAPSLGRLLIDHSRMSHRFYDARGDQSRQRIQEACDQHDAMIESIENRRSAQTVELTLQHWELSRSEMDKYVMPDPLPLEAALL